MSFGYVIERLTGVWKTRGPVGFLRFLFSRIARIDRDVLFEKDLSPGGPQQGPELELGQLTTIDHLSHDTPHAQALISMVLTGENSHYADGLRKKDMAFIVTSDTDDILHYSWVQFDSRYKKVLGESKETPMFTHCWTSPLARGRRLYPAVLRYGCSILADKGFSRVIITCHPNNIPSVKGIERAGFRKKRLITSLIFLSRLALQRIVSEDAPTRWRCIWL